MRWHVRCFRLPVAVDMQEQRIISVSISDKNTQQQSYVYEKRTEFRAEVPRDRKLAEKMNWSAPVYHGLLAVGQNRRDLGTGIALYTY